MISGGSPHDSASTFFSKFIILKLPDLIKLEIAKLVLAYFNNNLFDAFSNYFTLSSNISQKTTRSTNAHTKRLYTP